MVSNNATDKKEKPKIPLMSIAIGVLGMVWIILSYMQWGIWYPDLSQLILAISIGFGLLFLSYDHWWKRKTEKKLKEDVEELNETCDKILDYAHELDQKIDRKEK